MYAIQPKAVAKSESATMKINALHRLETDACSCASSIHASALKANMYALIRNAPRRSPRPRRKLRRANTKPAAQRKKSKAAFRLSGIRSIQRDGFSTCGVDQGPLRSKETTFP